MAFSGGQIWIGDVLAELSTHHSISMRQAAIDVFDVLARMGFVKMMKTMVTDGNTELGHLDPIPVKNYRAKLPCQQVQLIRIFDLETFRQLSSTLTTSHHVNLNNNRFNQVYTPDFWKSARQYELRDADVRDGFVFTSFKEGYLIVVYTVPPVDADGRLMIPSDPHVINLAKATAKFKAYQRLWEAGELSDKVYASAEQDYLWAKANSMGEGNMPTEEELEFTKNLLQSYFLGDIQFETHFAGVGRNENFYRQ